MADKIKKRYKHNSKTNKVLIKLGLRERISSLYAGTSDQRNTINPGQSVLKAIHKIDTKNHRSNRHGRYAYTKGAEKYPDSLTGFFEIVKKTVIEQSAKNSPKENPELDLSNIKIITPAQPSRKSEIIHQYTTLSRYLQFGLKKDNFNAAYEREIIERYEQLDEKGRNDAYNELKEEFDSL